MADDQPIATSPNPYPAMRGMFGLAQTGNIDLTQRPLVDMGKDSEGYSSWGTEYSMDFDDGDHRVVIPTIVKGKQVSPDEAKAHYFATGAHMGKFYRNTPQMIVDQYTNALHSRPQYVNGEPLNESLWNQMKDPNSFRNRRLTNSH
jgi:hypothetical protein